MQGEINISNNYTNFYRTNEIIKHILSHETTINASYNDIQRFLHQSLESNASKKHNYHRINDWEKQIYAPIDENLKRYGFVCGDIEGNKNKPFAKLWWLIHGLTSLICDSPNMKSHTIKRKSSAYDRNTTLQIELSHIMNHISQHKNNQDHTHNG